MFTHAVLRPYLLRGRACTPYVRRDIWPYSVNGHFILVDPASSHMLVIRIKPCMCKCKPLYGRTANGSLNQLQFT